MEVENLKKQLMTTEQKMLQIETDCQKEIEENNSLENELMAVQIRCKDCKDKIKEKNSKIAYLERMKTKSEMSFKESLEEMESIKHQLYLHKLALNGMIYSNIKLQDRLTELEVKNPSPVSTHVVKGVRGKKQEEDEIHPDHDKRSVKTSPKDEKRKSSSSRKAKQKNKKAAAGKQAIDVEEQKIDSKEEEEDKIKKNKYQRKKENKVRTAMTKPKNYEEKKCDNSI